jgi:hypothetical protein
LNPVTVTELEVTGVDKPTPVWAVNVIELGVLSIVNDVGDVAPAELTTAPVMVVPLVPSMPVPLPAAPNHLVCRVAPLVMDNGPVPNVTPSSDIRNDPVEVRVSLADIQVVVVDTVFTG